MSSPLWTTAVTHKTFFFLTLHVSSGKHNVCFGINFLPSCFYITNFPAHKIYFAMMNGQILLSAYIRVQCRSYFSEWHWLVLKKTKQSKTQITAVTTTQYPSGKFCDFVSYLCSVPMQKVVCPLYHKLVKVCRSQWSIGDRVNRIFDLHVGN